MGENLRRDPRCSLHVESGSHYDEATLFRIGVALNERQQGPREESRRPMVEHVIRNRVGARLRPERIVSWDHAKLPKDSYPVG